MKATVKALSSCLSVFFVTYSNSPRYSLIYCLKTTTVPKSHDWIFSQDNIMVHYTCDFGVCTRSFSR